MVKVEGSCAMTLPDCWQAALLAAYGRSPVRVVLDIHQYYLRSIFPRALPYLLLMSQVIFGG